MTEMLIGAIMVPDVSEPRPENVDVAFMTWKLGQIRRFCGRREALTVKQHHRLCGRLADRLGYGVDVVEWAEHHDDHEYVTGDIPTPLQRAIGMERIRAIQGRWDLAIVEALGLRLPTEEVREAVAFVDAVALGLEWRWRLGRDIDELGLADEIEGLTGDRKLIDVVLS